MYGLSRPFLFLLDAENAHDLSLIALRAAHGLHLSPLLATPPKPLPTKAFGLTFPNPVGLAAGLDKSGAHIDELLAFGFGFIEIGTVTPKPQSGNDRPRMFRLRRDQAIINRMGFNSVGVDALVHNVERAKRRGDGLLGINIGRNKGTPNKDAAKDYLHCLRKVYPLADYVAVNISSPNTSGLRELQEEQALRKLVGCLRDEQEALAGIHGKRVPVLVKIAPDLDEGDIDAAARVLGDLQVDGVIATNTTVSREGLVDTRHIDEAGGLSGAPLMASATATLRMMRTRLPDHIPMIGVGGIMEGADAATKQAAGAVLVQTYTGLVYRGPALIGECVEALRRRKEARSGALPLE
ncbi:MAG: quinone-dependent dihydroorotate dehydrogenase [Proteobacteria bacterium]|nr:quinone-dependent dihydroorotate dehydrogenase [Pseudomonadota bacterium]MBS0230540.1 quinone-dependent dihydroorotate dehydrogenase [Pseudomonadota bacterium]